MSAVIWKYALMPGTETHEMPKGARIVHVAGQGDEMCVWVECHPAAPTVERRLTVVPTGAEVPHSPSPRGWSHVGTGMLYQGGLVFHVYDAGDV
jgi:hypothetical protein